MATLSAGLEKGRAAERRQGAAPWQNFLTMFVSQVEYYSNTHSSYMEAEVQDVLEKDCATCSFPAFRLLTQDDEVLRVDLSIKKRADPSNLATHKRVSVSVSASFL